MGKCILQGPQPLGHRLVLVRNWATQQEVSRGWAINAVCSPLLAILPEPSLPIPPPLPWSTEKLSYTKSVCGAKKLGDRWSVGLRSPQG